APASAAAARTTEAAAEAAEDLVEHREDVADIHVREVVLPHPGHALVAELVVALSLRRIGEDLVRLGALLELELRLGLALALVAVRVILHRQPAIRALDLLAVGGAGDAQDFVVIAFDCGHWHSGSQFEVDVFRSAL